MSRTDDILYEMQKAKEAAKMRKLQDGLAKKQASGAAAKPIPSAQEQDTRTTQQKYNDAQKAYEDYTDSSTYRQGIAANQQNALQQAMDMMFAGGQDLPANLTRPVIQEDAKAKELEAAANYYKNQMQAEEDRKIMDTDLLTLDNMSDDDRQALQLYATNRNRDMNAPIELTTSPFYKTAEQEASALISKYGKQKVDELAESFMRSETQKTTEAVTEKARDNAGSGFLGAVGQSAASVGANLVGSMTGALGYLQEAGQGTGRYSTMDPNNAGNLPNAYAAAVRQEVAENIAGEDGSTGRELLSYGYQGIMSAADSIARAALFGHGSLGLAALGSFSQTMSEASRQGATPTQAAIMATGSAALEVATEYIPLDEMLKAAKGGAKGAMQVAGEALKQAGIEAATEEISLFGNLLLEAAVLQEKSSYKQQIGEAVAHGASYEEAKKQADRAVWNEAVQTAIVSGFSGAASGGGSAMVGNMTAQTAPVTQEQAAVESQTATQQQAAEMEPTAQQQEAPQAAQLPETPEQTMDFVMNDMGQKLAQTAPQKETAQKSEKDIQIQQATDAVFGVEAKETQKNTAENGGDNDGLRPYTQHEKENWKSSKRIVLFEGVEQFRQFIRNALSGNAPTNKKLYFGAINNQLATKIADATGLNVENYNLSLGENEIRKIQTSHGNEKKEQQRGQRAVTENDYLNIPNVIQNADVIRRSDSDYGGKPAIEFYKRNGNEVTAVVAVVSDKHLDVFVQTSYINKKTGSIATPESVQADSFTSETPGGTAPTNIIAEDGSGVKGVGAAEAENTTGAFGENTVGGAESRFKHEVRKSKVYDNTYANATEEDVRKIGEAALEADPNIAQYDSISEEESLYNAELRTRSKEEIDFEYNALVNKDGWSGEDNDTAFRVLHELRQAGDVERMKALAKKQREQGTKGGQFIQSFAKYSRTPTKAATDAILTLDDTVKSDIAKRYYRGKDFTQWKESVNKSILEIAAEIDAVQEGDAAAMQDIIRQLANFRRTTAWAGYTNRLTKAADRIVGKLDYETAKDIAASQLRMIPDDFRKRSVGETVKTVRIQNMLSAMTTTMRNLAGNATTGMMDALSDSTGGQLADMLMAKATGRRTVGNDVKYAKEYFTSAKDAADMAALCVELDIPMDTEAAYSTGKTRNYSPNSGPVVRFLSAYEKYLKYSLEVTDKFFEGGTAGAVNKSLQNLGEKSGLSQKEIDALAQKAGERRTFKEGRRLSKANTTLKEALNYIGTENIGAGDFLIPFAGVPGDVAQTGVDYSGAGLIEGFAEMASIIKDAKAGKEIDIYRQRKAATDFGRGMTGVGLIATFTTLAAMGIIGVHDDEDWDKNNLEKSMGKSGAQMNLDAAVRAMKGESTAWKAGDTLISFDFLEPYNSQMYIGYMIAQDDSILAMIKNYPKNAFQGIVKGVLDMPMMQTFSDTADLVKSMTEVSEGDYSAVTDAAGQLAGNVMSGFVPSYVRQTAQYIDPYYRDTSGENAMQKTINQFLATVPGLSKTLPKKYDGLGNEQLRYENKAEGFFDTFISPTDTGKLKQSEIADYLEELSNRTGDKTIYPEYLAPKSFKVNGETVMVSGKEMTETYQKTYGDNISVLYGSLMNNDLFNQLDENQQVEALKKAKQYATQFAKAAVSDYSDIQEGTPEEIVRGIVDGIVESEFTDAFSELTGSWKENREADVAESLEDAYDIYKSMSRKQQTQFKADHGGRVENYIKARERGVDTETFTELYKTYWDLDRSGATASQKAQKWAYALEKAEEAGKINATQKAMLKDEMVIMQIFPAQAEKFDQLSEIGLSADKARNVTQQMSAIRGTGAYDEETGKNSVRDVDKYETVANMDSLSDEERDTVMKAYMPDYDPEAKNPNKTELKYDYIREEMGFTAKQYAEILRTYTNVYNTPADEIEAKGSTKKNEYISQWMDKGYTREEATILYNLLVSTSKYQKIDVEKWHNAQ